MMKYYPSDSGYIGVTQGICPDDWHIPTDAELKTLEMHLGMSQADADAIYFRGTDEGDKLKETGISHWASPNTDATNESGFTLLPAGYRDHVGSMEIFGYQAQFRSATEDNSSTAWKRVLTYTTSQVYRSTSDKSFGCSVRCILDPPGLAISTDSIVNTTEATVSDTSFIVKISNSGGMDLIIDSIAGLENPFSASLATPYTISSEDTLQLSITLDRTYTVGTYIDSLQIYTNDKDTSIYLEVFLYDSTNSVTDYDNNVYKTVIIGNQVWMAENLKTTHYANGTAIPLVTDNTNWGNLGDNNTDKAYCYYDNSSSNGDIYGALYSWAAEMNGAPSSNLNPSGVQGACPAGWHLPSDDEWKELEVYMGMSEEDADDINYRGTNEGYKLKSASGWVNDGNGSNEVNFSIETAGGVGGHFGGLGNTGIFRCATVDPKYTYTVYTRMFDSNYNTISRHLGGKSGGYSVRCIKD